MKVKRRYLFPLLYVLGDAFSILFLELAPAIPVFFATLSVPSNFVLQTVSRAFGGPSDPTYFAYAAGVGTILLMFLLGFVWELLIDVMRKLFSRNRVAA